MKEDWKGKLSRQERKWNEREGKRGEEKRREEKEDGGHGYT